jgi:hypothetical protein
MMGDGAKRIGPPPLLLAAPQRYCRAQGFDPSKKQVVDYGMPKDFPANLHHDQLTCFFYSGLMVKPLTDDWNKGALGEQY